MSVEKIEVPADAETISEWKRHFFGTDDPGLTAAELSEAMGFSQSQMRMRLNAGVKDGTYTKGIAYRTKSDGTKSPVAVYQLVKKEPAKKKR